jgi:two-component system, cell cycle sensor histidine kinase and response regulator CckA
VRGESARRVLVVDDERLVLALASRILRDAGYSAVEAGSARQALGILERSDPPMDLVLTDVVMPETDGRVLGMLIADRYPGLPVAYMSAYPANDVFHRGAPARDAAFLSKPFSPEALIGLVEAALVCCQQERASAARTSEHLDRNPEATA